MYTLYSMRRSGNCYKVRLALAQLGIRPRAGRGRHPPGRDPHAGIPGDEPERPCAAAQGRAGKYLPESNAILWYLAEGTPLLSNDPIERAATLQWMFFEQHALEPNLGAAWFWLVLVKGGRELQQHALEDWMEEGYRALGVMDKHLAKQDFLADDRYSIADIALYAYTHVAEQCDFDLARFPGGARLARPRRGAAATTSRWTGTRRCRWSRRSSG